MNCIILNIMSVLLDTVLFSTVAAMIATIRFAFDSGNDQSEGLLRLASWLASSFSLVVVLGLHSAGRVSRAFVDIQGMSWSSIWSSAIAGLVVPGAIAGASLLIVAGSTQAPPGSGMVEGWGAVLVVLAFGVAVFEVSTRYVHGAGRVPVALGLWLGCEAVRRSHDWPWGSLEHVSASALFALGLACFDFAAHRWRPRPRG
jgi:hypothetical protein